MTYKELKDAIAELTAEQLSCDVMLVTSSGEVTEVFECRIFEELPELVQDELYDLDLSIDIECFPFLCDETFS
mgnify:CR=1 FL=1